jgi:hypothetical protein
MRVYDALKADASTEGEAAKDQMTAHKGKTAPTSRNVKVASASTSTRSPVAENWMSSSLTAVPEKRWKENRAAEGETMDESDKLNPDVPLLALKGMSTRQSAAVEMSCSPGSMLGGVMGHSDSVVVEA